MFSSLVGLARFDELFTLPKKRSICTYFLFLFFTFVPVLGVLLCSELILNPVNQRIRLCVGASPPEGVKGPLSLSALKFYFLCAPFIRKRVGAPSKCISNFPV